MEEFLNVIRLSPLFLGIAETDLLPMLRCLTAAKREYRKGEYILREGDPADSFGLLLLGSVHVIQEDFWGNHNILADLGPGEVFAESYACSPEAVLGVNVVACENATVLFLNVRHALTVCSSGCGFHQSLIRNLVAMLAAKNLRMNEKLQHVTQRSTREKLLSYLSAESRRLGSSSFEIPFNRQQLADYLSVDRSAMSAELCRLQDEGALRFRKNQFELHGE